jgi:uncharacterized protein YjbJ (UPF0337 family)
MHPGILGLRQRMPSAMSPTRSPSKGNPMNWEMIEGNWTQFKGRVKEKWGKLTDDNLDSIAGKRDRLAGKIQETYGITKDQAELQVKAFEQVVTRDRRDATDSRLHYAGS